MSDEVLERCSALRAFTGQRLHRLVRDIMHDAGVTTAHEPTHHLRAHTSETDHANLHRRLTHRRARSFVHIAAAIAQKNHR